MNAYGAMYAAQIVGGPDWLNKDAYDIKGKVPDDLEAAFQTMKRDDRIDQTAPCSSLSSPTASNSRRTSRPASCPSMSLCPPRRPQDHPRPRAARAQTRRPTYPNPHRRPVASRLFDDHDQ